VIKYNQLEANIYKEKILHFAGFNKYIE